MTSKSTYSKKTFFFTRQQAISFLSPKRLFILITYMTSFAIVCSSNSLAVTMSNNTYKIQLDNPNTTAGNISNTQYKVNTDIGQTKTGSSSNNTNSVQSGFQYLFASNPFSFTISDNKIDFGKLSPTNPVTRFITLTVQKGSISSYTVSVLEDRPLTASTSGAVIPDTTCDSGTCTHTSASAWENTLTYGFGYRCDNVAGTSCDQAFSQTSFFKQFPSALHQKKEAVVMQGKTKGQKDQAKITYKVNISGSQPGGVYTNTITYIASPSL